jgi:hypothetical protein
MVATPLHRVPSGMALYPWKLWDDYAPELARISIRFITPATLLDKTLCFSLHPLQ